MGTVTFFHPNTSLMFSKLRQKYHFCQFKDSFAQLWTHFTKHLNKKIKKKTCRFSGAKLKITFRFIVKRSCFKVEQTPLKLVFVSEWLSSSALRGTGGTVCSHTEGVNIARRDWRCNGVLKVTPVCRLRSVIKTDLRSVVRVWRGPPQEPFNQPVTLTKCECLGVCACVRASARPLSESKFNRMTEDSSL